jgi:small-conductance mechanosensitive channel
MNLQPLIQSLTAVGTDIVLFLPRLVNGLILIIAGWLVSWLVRRVLRFLFRQIRLERLFERAGLHRVLRSLGIRLTLSEIIVQAVFLFILLSFLIQGASLVGLTPVALLLQEVLLFVPRAISAALLLLVGALVARVLGETTATVARNVQITYGRVLGKLIEYVLIAFVVVLALATLGVETTILTTSLTIIVASAGLALALSFAFGARDVARNVLAGYYVRQQFRPGQIIRLGEYRGLIRSTSGTYTTLEFNGDQGQQQVVVLPNTLLLHRVAVSEEENTLPPAG